MPTRYYLAHIDAAAPAVFWTDAGRDGVAHAAQLGADEGGPTFHTADRDLAYSVADSFNAHGYACAVVAYKPGK